MREIFSEWMPPIKVLKYVLREYSQSWGGGKGSDGSAVDE